LVIVLDRLPAHLIGAYGNAWIRTPALDALAAESLLFEFATIDSPRLDGLYRSFWQGIHAARSNGHEVLSANELPSLLRAKGVKPILLTDEPEVAGLPLTQSFDELIRIEGARAAQPADSVESTQLGRFFTTAADAIQSATAGPSLFWLHSQGLAGPWDAPLELRNYYAAEDDPEPPTTVEPPNRLLAPDHDPDERLGIAQAAAGQVTALDECLESLLGAIDPCWRETALLIVIGARGLPLGEHLRLGPCDEALYEELVHVPLLVRIPDSLAPLRTQALAQCPDIFATLMDWFDCQQPGAAGKTHSRFQGASLLPLVADPVRSLRDSALTVGARGPAAEWSIRTPAWYLRHSSGDSQEEPPRVELYVKPDDRFEVNDVARRCGDVVEQLDAAGAAMLQAAESGGELESLAPLPSHLVEAVD